MVFFSTVISQVYCFEPYYVESTHVTFLNETVTKQFHNIMKKY